MNDPVATPGFIIKILKTNSNRHLIANELNNFYS